MKRYLKIVKTISHAEALAAWNARLEAARIHAKEALQEVAYIKSTKPTGPITVEEQIEVTPDHPDYEKALAGVFVPVSSYGGFVWITDPRHENSFPENAGEIK